MRLDREDSELQSLAALEAAYRKKAVWKSNESVATLRQWCSSAILRAKQREGHAAGLNCRLRATSGNPLGFYDPYHLFHNMAIGLIFGPRGEGYQGGCLNINILRQAAELTGCPLLSRIANQTVDKHSHMSTYYFLTHSGLHFALRAMASRAAGKADEADRESRRQEAGAFRAEHDACLLDAVVLENLGGAAQAWLSPHLTQEWRTKVLETTRIFVHRLFGRNLYDTASLCTSERSWCVTVNQLLDLFSNAEARLQWLASLPAQARGSAKETAQTTRFIESHFSRLFSNVGSGNKPTQHEIQGKVLKLDALIGLMRDEDKGFEIQESRRKRKFVEAGDGDWNDGCPKKRMMFEADVEKRVWPYTENRASTRTHNQRAGNVG